MNWSDIWTAMGQILAGVALGLLALLAKKMRDWIKKKSISQAVNANLMLKQILAEIRSYYDADRVQLYQFHNGEYFVSGTSIQKLSLTHFVTGRGVSVPIGATDTHQNIPIGYITQTADEILRQPFVFFSGQEIFGESYFKGILRYGGANAALLVAIFNTKHDMIGILAISWFEQVTLTPEQKESVKGFATQLSDELLLGSK